MALPKDGPDKLNRTDSGVAKTEHQTTNKGAPDGEEEAHINRGEPGGINPKGTGPSQPQDPGR
jgi:hypothetical protein